MNASRLLVFGGLAAIFPLAAADAQPRRGQMRPRVVVPREPSASELLDRRRELDLNPRQVARLDSIERAEFSERRAIRQRMTQQVDSVCANRRPCVLTPEERGRFRSRMEELRPQREQMLRGDSVARSQAYALLDSTQRGRLQTMREQRVMRARGMHERGMRMRDRMDGPRGLRDRGFRRPGMRGYERNRMQLERRQFERRLRREFSEPRARFRDMRPRRGPGDDSTESPGTR